MSRKSRPSSPPNDGAALIDWLDQAIDLHRAGRLAEAEPLYRRVLARLPEQPDALHLLGVLSWQSNRIDEAAALVAKALAVRPDFAAACNSLGNILAAAGRSQEAAGQYRRALALNSGYLEAANNLVVTLLVLGRFDEAEAEARRVLAQRPDHVEAHYNLGNALRGQGRLDEAADSYRRVHAFNPGHGGAHNNLGMTLKALGRSEEAIGSFRMALATQPDAVEAAFNLGALYHDQGAFVQAAVCFARVTGISHDHAEAWFALALALHAQDRNGEAVEGLKRVLTLDPGHLRAIRLLGSLSARLGRHDQAAIWLRQAVAFDPANADAWYDLGCAERELIRPAAGAAAFRRVVTLDSRRIDVLNDLAVMLLDLERPHAALAGLRRLLAVQPGHAVAYNNCGIAHERLGDQGRAVEAYRQAIGLRPDYVKAYSNLGNALETLHRSEEAEVHLRRALALDDAFVDARINLGSVLLSLDRVAEAEQCLRRAVEQRPDLSEAHGTLGIILLTQGRLAEAETVLKRGLDLRADYPEALVGLGMIRAMQLQPASARIWYDRALALKPTLAIGHLDRGLLVLGQGQLDLGWADYGWRFSAKGYRDRMIQAPIWRGEPLDGHRVLVWREQGLGDELMFATLVAAHLAQRPALHTLSGAEARQEEALRRALLQPGSVATWPLARGQPRPVPLWPAPWSGEAPLPPRSRIPDPDQDNSDSPPGRVRELAMRRKAERVAMPRDGVVLPARFESILSLADFVPVDRPCDEEDDKSDPAVLVMDLQHLSVARDHKPVAARLRFDLDLPGEAADDIPLGEGILLPEWDWKKGELRPERCRLIPMLPREAVPRPLPAHLQRPARRLRGQFEAFRPQRHWQRRQADGAEPDLDGWIEFQSQRRAGRWESDPRLFRRFVPGLRDLSCLLLADLSLSTAAYVGADQQVIEVIRETLLLFAEALSAAGDRLSLCGFSSRRREEVRFYPLKSFAERYDDTVRGKILALKPGYYTRMGAAIRQATLLLAEETASRRLMLLLTDGKPHDLDGYDGRFGIEDTRMALLELRRAGITPFAITIDDQAGEYADHLFGVGGHAVIRRPEELSARLPLLYARLTEG
ncbi:nitric oxide reductase NorD protein [uncultured Gammaproteobacteria bacterium]